MGLPHFGTRLRTRRRAVGLKQAALSEELGVDQATISRWERGQQRPDKDIEARVLKLLGNPRCDNGIKRLVENSHTSAHLIDDCTHVCLAYSKPRAAEWCASSEQLIGTPLWEFATDEIHHAENRLQDAGWWETYSPLPQKFHISKTERDYVGIEAGLMVWERLYLMDGTPVRLCSSY